MNMNKASILCAATKFLQAKGKLAGRIIPCPMTEIAFELCAETGDVPPKDRAQKYEYIRSFVLANAPAAEQPWKSIVTDVRREQVARKEKKRKTRLRVARLKVAYETTDAFLMSYEWRRLRMEAIKKYGARCQCCGASPETGAVINVDHIKPRRIFPQLALDINNLQVLCQECNHGKGNWDMTDWRHVEQSA